jgi:hypothetical protein
VNNFRENLKATAGESRGEGAVKFVLAKSCFLLWLWVEANAIGWLLAFSQSKTC